MKPAAKSIVIPTLSLFLIALIVSFLLALTNAVTAKRIAALGAEKTAQTRKTVLSQAVGFTSYRDSAGQFDYDEGYDGNHQVVGYVFTTKTKGYGGDITVMTGLDPEGKIRGVEILSSTETPGLGLKANDKRFTDQYNQGQSAFSVTKATPGENEIQAITGATITSRAVTQAVNEALRCYQAVRESQEANRTAEVKGGERDGGA